MAPLFVSITNNVGEFRLGWATVRPPLHTFPLRNKDSQFIRELPAHPRVTISSSIKGSRIKTGLAYAVAPVYQLRCVFQNGFTEASGAPQARAPQAVPEYVTATAALLGLIYPGHGVETSLRTDHVERMTFQDYIKVMSVSATPFRHTLSHVSRGCESEIASVYAP
jgi:hypothetical protein